VTRAQRLKRVFAIDIETCRRCGRKLWVIASIKGPATIERILQHLGGAGDAVDPAHPSRAPPRGDLKLCGSLPAGSLGRDGRGSWPAIMRPNGERSGRLSLDGGLYPATSPSSAGVSTRHDGLTG